ncbi:MAG TPA: IclR family transcriptional regulator [Terracidiphilus sp.]|jgi:DNA-binding IclR family transcriptional regulator|nr:IclR family transcriptional regulator [Terracidiphilus sp.]
MRDSSPQGTYKVQALDRAFAVLDLLGESDTPLGLAQVAASLQLHKSTAHRFLMVLERHHMVERTSGGKFRLGLRLFDYGNRAIEQYDLRERAQPHLRRLVAETEETAHLCILEQARVIYIDKIEPARSVRMITRIGSSNSVHCTSVGKAMLAFLPEDRMAEVVRRTRFERHTSRTIASAEALRAEIEKTRRRGYAVDDEELEEGLRCIAVPLLDAQRYPVAAISVSGPSFRVTAQKLPSIANHLLHCVRSISLDMGYTSANRNRAAWSSSALTGVGRS